MVDTLRILMSLANPANTSVASLLLAKEELDYVICAEPNQLLEEAAAGCLRAADEAGYSNLEVYWGLNRACASLELAWARAMTDEDS